MWDWFIRGGPVMAPILLCSILSVAIIIERSVHLARVKIDTKGFLQGIVERITGNRMMEASALCEKTPGPIARILRAGILKYDRPRAEIKEAIEEAGLHEIPALERRLPMLATIAHVAPLLGLLGTVTGLVRCFQVIQEKSTVLNPINPGDLAGGIWEALITTVAGLVVAIPTYVAYNTLVSVVEDFVMDMETSATELVNVLTRKGKGNDG